MRMRIMKPIIITLIILGAILFTSLPSLSQVQSEQLSRDKIAEKINAIIDEEIKNSDLIGATIAVYYKGSPLITRGIGYADEPNQIKVNEQTGFRIGSNTKLFTALSIMRLVEENKISLDDSIFKYLPDYQPNILPGVNPDNRIRDLLTHHNGIPSLWIKDFYIETPSLEPLRNLPQALSEDYLVENRREVRSYTNAAYALAGLIIERVSGQAYDDYIKEHFFDAFNMNDTHVFLPENRENIALPHKNHHPFDHTPILMIPAGSIITSASDMQKFMEMIIDTWHGDEDDLIKDKTLKQMSEYQHTGVTYDTKEFMGLGFEVNKKHNSIHLSHGGRLPSFVSDVDILPELETGVFIAINSEDEGSIHFYANTRDNILKVLIKPDTINNKISNLPSLKTTLPTTGDYIVRSSTVITITHEDQIPYITVLGDKYKLKPLDLNSWEIAQFPLGKYTLHNAVQYEGYIIQSVSNSFATIPLIKYESSDNWKQYENKVYSTNITYYGNISLTLRYDQTYKCYITQVQSENKELDLRNMQHIISDSLLQGQGKGTHASLITHFLDKNTVKFSGLTLTLDKTSNAIQKRNLTMAPPLSEKMVLQKLKSIFSSKPVDLF